VPTLFVKCRACGRDFPTPIGEPKADSKGVIISGLRLRCPKCGREEQYSTADFHTLTSPAAPGGRDVATDPDLKTEHEAKETGAQEKLAGYGIVPPEGRSPHEG
jgi:DNA-directed RNA polymerase subunit M/transcription elongation factor TFIIS